MDQLQGIIKKRPEPITRLPTEIAKKVELSLITHVYNQIQTGLGASIFCAAVVFVGLYSSEKSNINLYLWSLVYLGITSIRFTLTYFFKRERIPAKREKLWRNLYIVGALFGGISWGLGAFLLFPYATDVQQMLLVLMLAGVTGGSSPLSSALPSAAISFLICSLVPYIVVFTTFNDITYLIFDLALVLYLAYTITLVLKMADLIRNSIILKFENDNLLISLSEAKNQLEISNKKLEQAATHDPLTKIANRSLFKDMFNNALTKAKKNQTTFALLYIDLDHFKKMNDLYGHEAGDLILTTTIDRIANLLGSSKKIARLGGDEIAVILDNVSNMNEIIIIARKICQLIAMPIFMNKIELNVTASIGIGLYPHDATQAEELLRAADKNMYLVKSHGGNDFCFTKESINI